VTLIAVNTLDELQDALRRGLRKDELRRDIGQSLIAMLESPAPKTRREVQHLLAAVNLLADGLLRLVLWRMRAARLSNLRATLGVDAEEQAEVPNVAALVAEVRRLSGAPPPPDDCSALDASARG